jgi:hypothetical protein
MPGRPPSTPDEWLATERATQGHTAIPKKPNPYSLFAKPYDPVKLAQGPYTRVLQNPQQVEQWKASKFCTGRHDLKGYDVTYKYVCITILLILEICEDDAERRGYSSAAQYANSLKSKSGRRGDLVDLIKQRLWGGDGVLQDNPYSSTEERRAFRLDWGRVLNKIFELTRPMRVIKLADRLRSDNRSAYVKYMSDICLYREPDFHENSLYIECNDGSRIVFTDVLELKALGLVDNKPIKFYDYLANILNGYEDIPDLPRLPRYYPKKSIWRPTPAPPRSSAASYPSSSSAASYLASLETPSYPPPEPAPSFTSSYVPPPPSSGPSQSFGNMLRKTTTEESPNEEEKTCGIFGCFSRKKAKATGGTRKQIKSKRKSTRKSNRRSTRKSKPSQ